jgi:hypothetical protein
MTTMNYFYQVYFLPKIYDGLTIFGSLLLSEQKEIGRKKRGDGGTTITDLEERIMSSIMGMLNTLVILRFQHRDKVRFITD